MFLSSLLSYLYKDGITADLFLSGVLVSIIGLLMLFLNKSHDKQINKRDIPAVVDLIRKLAEYEGCLSSVDNTSKKLLADIFTHHYCDAIVAEKDNLIQQQVRVFFWETYIGENINFIFDKKFDVTFRNY